MTSDRPPRIAEWIMRRAAPRDDLPWILDDLNEEFLEHVVTSRTSARSWYWRQTIRSIAPLLVRRWVTFTSGKQREHMWNDVAQDLRFAARLSRRAPLTTFVVVATLVLGLGATTSVLSVVDAVLIRPLPFAASARTVELFGVLRDGNQIPDLAYPDLQDLRVSARAIDALGIGEANEATLQRGADAERIATAEVDSGFTRVLDFQPILGRLFDADAYGHGGRREVMLTHGFWLREFGGDRSIIGQSITLDGAPASVVGVLDERAFVYPNFMPDVIRPLDIAPGSLFTRRGVMWATAVARARPGASIEDVQREVVSVAHRLELEFPDANKGIGMRAKPLRDVVVGDVGSMLALLTAAVGVVLLIASLNVGNLLLARAAFRSREFAIRVAIGGNPWRVRRQVLAEAALLATVGGVVGMAIAPLLTRLLLAVYPGDLPRAAEVHLGIRTLFDALGAMIAASVLASIPMLRHATSASPALDLRATGGTGQRLESRRFERFVFGAQIAASLTLVFVAGLLVRSLRELSRIQPGFESSRLVAFAASPSPERQPDPSAYYRRLTDAVAHVPGVTSVVTAWHVPFGGNSHTDVFVREDKGNRGPANPQSNVDAVEPGFDRILGSRVLAGRAFTTADDSAGPAVALINKTLAATAFAGEDPIGKAIAFGGGQHRRIIGVVEDMKDGSLVDPAPAMLYLPLDQYPQPYVKRDRYVMVRTSRDPSAVMSDIRAVVRSIDASVPLTDVHTMDERLSTAAAAFRFRAALLAGLGALACLLAVVGVYGIVAESVNRQRREIGIRLALGMTPAGVQRRVIAGALRTAAIGVGVGLVVSLMIGPALRSLLYGVAARDASLLVSATLAVCAAATAAAFVPARRASRVDPILALRND